MKEIFVLGDDDPPHVIHRQADAALDTPPGDARSRWVATDSGTAFRAAGRTRTLGRPQPQRWLRRRAVR